MLVHLQVKMYLDFEVNNKPNNKLKSVAPFSGLEVSYSTQQNFKGQSLINFIVFV